MFNALHENKYLQSHEMAIMGVIIESVHNLRRLDEI